jgi:hypothetical protein
VSLDLVPITQREARDYVERNHRHSVVPAGGVFQVGLTTDGETICGVAIVGRPVSRVLDADPYTAELTRLCTDGTPNACSKLYATCWRAARALGYRRLITYIRQDESGISLAAAGWRLIGEVKARSWHTPSRPRVDRDERQDRLVFEAGEAA